MVIDCCRAMQQYRRSSPLLMRIHTSTLVRERPSCLAELQLQQQQGAGTSLLAASICNTTLQVPGTLVQHLLANVHLARRPKLNSTQNPNPTPKPYIPLGGSRPAGAVACAPPRASEAFFPQKNGPPKVQPCPVRQWRCTTFSKVILQSGPLIIVRGFSRVACIICSPRRRAGGRDCSLSLRIYKVGTSA